MGILSIQSHVVYGYVGNKAAVYPLQSMGYDVWPINTVQFSRHTGYKTWEGKIFPREHIKRLLKGVEDAGLVGKCKAILSGYMGSHDSCIELVKAVKKFKAQNNKILYLCDPVMGDTSCYVKPEIIEFFKKNKMQADIMTPNRFEAEVLSGIKIQNIKDLEKVAQYFHSKQVKILVITGIEISSIAQNKIATFVSDELSQNIVLSKKYDNTVVSGTGDLFAAVFLGKYLLTKNALDATRKAVHFTELAIKNSIDFGSAELLVPSIGYKEDPTIYDNEIICLDSCQNIQITGQKVADLAGETKDIVDFY